MEQFIICPDCGSIELAIVEYPDYHFVHFCSKCEYIIMESDWQPAKAISIKQPWASLICLGIKDIENRTWKLPEKYKGKRILVHAGSKEDKRWFDRCIELTESMVLRTIEKAYNKWEYHRSFGTIIGSVEIVDCVINHSSIWAEGTISKEYPIYNWILANPVKFDKPIPCKGQLSFFTPKID